MKEEELKLEKIYKRIKDTGHYIDDIRVRPWYILDCDASKILNLLIEIEDLFTKFDEYQMKNNQCYPEFEDFMLQIGDIRYRYTEFIDNNLEVLAIKTKKN